MSAQTRIISLHGSHLWGLLAPSFHPLLPAFPSSCCHCLHAQVQSRCVRVTNATKASVEADVKASSSDRYSISPSSFRLRPGEAAELSISLRLDPKFAQRRKAIESGQRDAILIKVCVNRGNNMHLATQQLQAQFMRGPHVQACKRMPAF